MAQIYEGNLQGEMRSLERELKQPIDFHPTLNYNSGRRYSLLTTLLLASAIAVVGTADAEHVVTYKPGSSDHSLSGIFFGEGEIKSKNFTHGYDSKEGTSDDKILLKVEDWYEKHHVMSRSIDHHKTGVHEFRIEPKNISETLSSLDKELSPGKWLKFRYRNELHQIVQIDEILPPSYTEMREQEEALREAEDAKTMTYFMYGTPPAILAFAGLMYLFGKRDEKIKQKKGNEKKDDIR